MRRLLIGMVASLLVCATLSVPITHAASAFAAPAFQQQWQQGEALAPNFWGPLATARDGQQEPYTEASGGQRLVQYFDKGRMELTNGTLTNGLLATELIKGQIQVGDAAFEPKAPPAIPIAGDPDNPGPTYAQLGTTAAALLAPAAQALTGGAVLTHVDASGGIVPGGNLLDDATFVGMFDAATRHNVIRAFAQYRDKIGLQTVGYAISEPFVATVKVAGQQRAVVVQAFERRVLTYTASNDPAFRVEMGNIGRHYDQWRYGGIPVVGTPPAASPTAAPAAASGVWIKAASMAAPRAEQQAVALKDGTVLVIGALTAAAPEAERYDPVRDVWSPAPDPPTNHGGGFVAVALADGRVLLLGGQRPVCTDSGRCFIALDTAEIYDPAANRWTAVAPMHDARNTFTATLLANGQVLVVGGSGGGGSEAYFNSLATAERYDPVSNTWTPVASLATARYGHAAALLADGTVLVAGGTTAHGLSGNPQEVASAERYDPARDTWSDAGTLPHALARGPFDPVTAIRLGDGTVLVAGGAILYRYDPARNAWAAVAAPPTSVTVQYTTTVLPTGKVLVAGGTIGPASHYDSRVVADAALYDPATDTWSATGSMTTARSLHTATLLANGQVLVAGGYTSASTDPTASAERYTP